MLKVSFLSRKEGAELWDFSATYYAIYLFVFVNVREIWIILLCFRQISDSKSCYFMLQFRITVHFD